MGGHRIDLALISHTRRQDNPIRLIIELRVAFFTRCNAVEKDGGKAEGEWWTGGANLAREKREDSFLSSRLPLKTVRRTRSFSQPP